MSNFDVMKFVLSSHQHLCLLIHQSENYNEFLTLYQIKNWFENRQKLNLSENMLLWCYYDLKKKEGMPAYYGDYDQIKCLHANDQSVVSVV